MKKVFAIILGLVFVLAFALTPQKNSLAKNALEGTWKFVSGKFTTGGELTEMDSTKRNAIKVFTPTHVTFFAMSPDKQQFDRAAVCTLEVKGNTYTETIEYSSIISVMGKKNQYEYRIEGDKLYQSGTNNGRKEETVWQRVK